MVRRLLIAGMIAGLLAGLLVAGAAQLVGEPAIERSIALEDAQAHGGEAQDGSAPALVSRPVQRSVGLAAAAGLFGVAAGGLLALTFAWARGRMAGGRPWSTALWLAGGAFVVVFLVPFVKYPSNPPAVGDPDTVGERTALYGTMVSISLASGVAALRLRAALVRRASVAVATVLGASAYLVLSLGGALALPDAAGAPAAFPAETLWDFRVASAGLQALLWAAIGVGFGWAAERTLRHGRDRVAA